MENKVREVKLTVNKRKKGFAVEKINSSDKANKYARQFYFDDIEIYESCFIILLDRANNTIGWAKIGQGGCCNTLADPKIIAKYALESLAQGIVFVHNHPSGSLNPSINDDKLMKSIGDVLKIIEVQFVDSIILAPSGDYYSYKDEGKL